MDALLCTGLLAGSVAYFIVQYTSVTSRINNERETYISEVTGKIADNIDSRLLSLKSESTIYESTFTQSNTASFSDCQKLFAEAPDDVVFLLADDQGGIYQTSGEPFSFSNRDLLVSLIFVDRKSSFSYEKTTNNSDYWVFAYPCDSHPIDGHNIKGFMVTYPAEKFASSFTLSLFNEEGYALMVDSDGTIQLKPTLPPWIGYNLFTSLENNGFPTDGLNSLQNVFTDKKPGNVTFNLNGAKYLLHYESIADADLGLTSAIVIIVPVGVITRQVTVSMNMLVIATISVAVVLLVILVQVIFILKKNADARRDAEEKSKMEIAIRTAEVKNEFLARMSHDIRTPLNAMIGSATLALKESNNSATNRYLSDIDESGKFLLSLVNDLLDLNKVESGKMTLHLAPYSLAEFAEAMTSIVGPLCKEKSIVFSLEGFESKQPYEIDAIRFKQIFFNLLSNSVKFTPAGGRISLRGSWGKSEDNFDKLLVTESDNGAGMSEEFQQKMFDPFSQEDRLMTPGVNGTGLGLAIVKSLVALMGGEIHVRSAIGVGTTFSLSFPLKKSSAQPIVEPAIEAANESLLKGVRVLLCEDNPMNTKIAKALLEAKGMKVETAVNGKAGLERFASSQPHSFDVILMDMRMPVMDGVTATKEIRALHRPEAKSIPIIAMTANAYAEDVKACLEAGMNAHLAKPVDPEAMYQEIIRALPKK